MTPEERFKQLNNARLFALKEYLAATNNSRKRRYKKEADKIYRKMQSFVRINHLPRELAP